MQEIYENKDTKQVVVSSKKLDKKHWKFVKKVDKMNRRNTKMNSDNIIKK